MEYLTLNNNTQMPLVGFGTFLLNGKPALPQLPLRFRQDTV